MELLSAKASQQNQCIQCIHHAPKETFRDAWRIQTGNQIHKRDKSSSFVVRQSTLDEGKFSYMQLVHSWVVQLEESLWAVLCSTAL